MKRKLLQVVFHCMYLYDYLKQSMELKHTVIENCGMLKPMDSFGKWWKWKLIHVCIFFFVNAEFYWVVWTINALWTVRSEMLPFSENNQNIEIFPRTLCHRWCT